MKQIRKTAENKRSCTLKERWKKDTCVRVIPGLAGFLDHSDGGLEAAAVAALPPLLLGGRDVPGLQAAADEDVGVEVRADQRRLPALGAGEGGGLAHSCGRVHHHGARANLA